MARKANNVVNMNNVKDAVSAQRDKVMKFGFSPKQARAAIGKLSAGFKVDGLYQALPVEFKAELATAINSVAVDDDDRQVVKDQREFLVMRGEKPWDEKLDEFEAMIDDNEHLRVGYANAVAWFRHLRTHRSEKANPADLLGRRRGRITTRGQLKKLGFTDADVDAAFPSLPAETRRRSQQTRGDAMASASMGGGMHTSGASHREPAPQIDPLKLLDALMEAGMDYPKARSIVDEKPETPMAILDALMGAGMDYSKARPIAGTFEG